MRDNALGYIEEGKHRINALITKKKGGGDGGGLNLESFRKNYYSSGR